MSYIVVKTIRLMFWSSLFCYFISTKLSFEILMNFNMIAFFLWGIHELLSLRSSNRLSAFRGKKKHINGKEKVVKLGNRFFIFEQEELNAYALTKRSMQGEVHISSPLEKHLGQGALNAVIAHEICHINFNDTKFQIKFAHILNLLSINLLFIFAYYYRPSFNYKDAAIIMIFAFTLFFISTCCCRALNKIIEFRADFEAVREGLGCELIYALSKISDEKGGLLSTHPNTELRVKMIKLFQKATRASVSS